jgi:hypothetical protein
MKKYTEYKDIKKAIREAKKQNYTTYVVYYTEGAELVYRLNMREVNNNEIYYISPLENEEEFDISIKASIEEVEKELFNKGIYQIINTMGIMGLSQFLFENKGGFLDIFGDEKVLFTKSQSMALIGAAAANLDKEISIGDFKILPDRTYSFIYKLKINDELGVRHTYTMDISKF